MVREDLYITVPSFFKCPISLDVMKSPVSLCTGVTYDRSSIQRWLDNGNNTCPATMQVLQSKEIVPNRTLQRLIQIWSDSVRERVNSAESQADNSVPSQDRLVEIIRGMEIQTEKRLDSLSKIVCFAEESEENRKFLAKIDGFVPMLVRFLDNADGGVSVSVEFLDHVVRVLDLVLSKFEDCELLKNLMLKGQGNCLDSMLLVLQQGSTDSRIGSSRVLQSIAIDAESKLLIAGKEGLMSELLKLITPDKDPALIEAGLSCLISISIPRRIKIKLAQQGVIKIFSKLLSESNSSLSITEKVLKLIETVSSCKEGRSEICEDPVCVPAILQKVLKVSSMATEHAVTILWSVCYLFRDQMAQEAVTKANGLTKILLLMQSNCTPAVRQMSADLLKIFRVNSKSCLSCYDTKTTHIMPF
ncbi:RING-type E3 ubiquitin transferase [Quillaja saponaria]|uniref:U-box domain-containing protein n=1 Tax=Quillaja saponaria TaxID=32244 RepID=A0AAD7LF26_QUISA|nr:RING-type E3 ubiquitin transferase [Quillaja saponaria]